MKSKTCKSCRNKFEPMRQLQSVCSAACAIAIVRTKQAKRAAKQQRQDKQRIKTKAKWMEEAQAAFNAFIRARDAQDSCICCGKMPDSTDWMGGLWDAGHYLSRGAFPELRFEELNAHKQLKSCNGGSGKYAKKGRTVNQGYRENLIKKIGLDKVEWLEGKHEAKHYTIDEIREIKEHYKQKTKQLTGGS